MKLASPTTRRKLLSVLVVSVAGFPGVGWAQQTETSPPELHRQGQKLRSDIISVYQALQANRSLRPKNNIDDVIRKYIPSGMSFDKAEQILRGAGFEVDRHLDPDWKKKGERAPLMKAFERALTARLDLDHGLFFKVEAIVALETERPYDYSTVRDATGSIFYDTP